MQTSPTQQRSIMVEELVLVTIVDVVSQAARTAGWMASVTSRKAADARRSLMAPPVEDSGAPTLRGRPPGPSRFTLPPIGGMRAPPIGPRDERAGNGCFPRRTVPAQRPQAGAGESQARPPRAAGPA